MRNVRRQKKEKWIKGGMHFVDEIQRALLVGYSGEYRGMMEERKNGGNLWLLYLSEACGGMK